MKKSKISKYIINFFIYLVLSLVFIPLGLLGIEVPGGVILVLHMIISVALIINLILYVYKFLVGPIRDKEEIEKPKLIAGILLFLATFALIYFLLISMFVASASI